MHFKYFKPEDVQRLHGFEFAPRALAEGYLAGRHVTPHRGASTEFHDYRAYAPGDDPSSVDWRVFARTDRHYVKTFEQETNVDCHILLDASASMGFGENPSKLEYASFFAAALAYLVTRGSDLVSLLVFDEALRHHFPPGSTVSHLHRLFNVLEKQAPGNPTRLADTLQRAFPLFKRRGTLVLLSDFYEDPTTLFQALNPYFHQGFDVHLIHILAPEERTLADHGLVAYRDLETGQKLVTHTRGLQETYTKVLDRHISLMREFSVRRRARYRFVTTNTHYFTLFDLLRRT